MDSDGSGTMTGRKLGRDEALGLEAILAAGRRLPGGRGGHSPLYEWLWGRYEALAEELNPPRRPSWDGIAAGMIAQYPGDKAGLIADGQGKPPTGERVRKAWWQVRRDKQRLATGPAPKGQPVAQEPPAPVAPVPAPKAPAPVAVVRAPPPPAAAAAAEDDTDVLRFAGGRKTLTG